MLSMQANLQGITIEVNLEKNKDRIVFIDKIRTQQILINLLQNSIKFSKEYDVIIVTLSFYDVENP